MLKRHMLFQMPSETFLNVASEGSLCPNSVRPFQCTEPTTEIFCKLAVADRTVLRKGSARRITWKVGNLHILLRDLLELEVIPHYRAPGGNQSVLWKLWHYTLLKSLPSPNSSPGSTLKLTTLVTVTCWYTRRCSSIRSPGCEEL